MYTDKYSCPGFPYDNRLNYIFVVQKKFLGGPDWHPCGCFEGSLIESVIESVPVSRIIEIQTCEAAALAAAALR